MLETLILFPICLQMVVWGVEEVTVLVKDLHQHWAEADG